MFDWNDLRIFLAIAHSGSALAAAKELNLNQTTVTRRMDALEHALGVGLFFRDARGSHLTPEAEVLLTHARQVEAAVLRVDGEAGRLKRNISGVIRITAPEVIMAMFVGPLTLRFRRQHPEVRFDYISAEHRLDLAKGEADIAFRAGGVLEGDTLISIGLPDVYWAAYCSHGYAATHAAPNGLAQMAGQRVIGYGPGISQMSVSKIFMAQIDAADIVGTSNSVPNMAGMIKAGLGIGILPCLSGDLFPELQRCFAPLPEMSTAWWIVAAPEAHNLAPVRRFMGFAAEALRSLRPLLQGELDHKAAVAVMAAF